MSTDALHSPAAALTAALRERRALIADETSRRNPEEHLGKLKAISEKIVALAEALPRPLDPQLAHYLARCSYDKALAALEAM
ncbi:MAG: hypothetical protein H0W43_03550 [Chthoniobacterales bacterium]|jgi:hypothetical protein|nr:hypothetical protein [Chthoniobacterales bacterium]